MDSSTERPGGRYAWTILAVICQGLVAFMPMVEVCRTVAAWSVWRDVPGYDPTPVFIAALAAALLLATAIGLALPRSWGWALALMVNAFTAEFFALRIIAEPPQPSSWATWELVVAIIAIVALLLPPVRTHYSRRRTPWILSWWAQPLNTGIDKVLAHLVAVAHVLFNTVLLLKVLAVFPYSGWMFLWPAFGIFGGVKLYSDPKLGRLLTLGWCILGLIVGINAWIAAIADLSNPAVVHRKGMGDFVFFCFYCGMVGLYLFLTVVKGWLDDINGVSPSAPRRDC